MTSNMLKIVIIDNDRLFHNTYALYFEKYNDYELKGIYASIEEALAQSEEVRPDIILSEMALPDISGLEGIKMLKKKNPKAKIIMISDQSDFEMVKKAFKNGASGYLTKPINAERLHHAFNSIKYEGAVMSNDIARKVISMFQRKTRDFFSDRENEVIDYLCQGATYKTIADKLFVTTSAVNFHIQNIYLKLNVNSKSEALLKLQAIH
ncbi:response regulator transcription factor [Spongiimicrobium salis]|uniref:response regulator transcription factor n=1 Tax=Spongiimicrobium salis TaxID=1667022 RepID=UPI00374CDEE3